MKKYGDFSEDGLEFIIRDPKTPRPWTNYLYNERYCLVLSHTGGGYSFFRDCKRCRITRWQGQNLTSDSPGHYLYLRDDDTGDFWSSTWQPIAKEVDNYECRHGLGYTTISVSQNEISTDVTYFVPLDDDVEIWKIRVKNDSSHSRNLSMMTYMEWLLGNRDDDLILPAIICLYLKADYIEDFKGIFATSFGAKKEEDALNGFIGGSFEPEGFETSKEMFIGRYRTLANPVAVERGACESTNSHGEDIVGVLHNKFTIDAQQEKEFVVVMGKCTNKKHASEYLEKYRDMKNVNDELDRIHDFWDKIVGRLQVSTPNENFNIFVNVWGKAQLYACNYWSRSSSFYHEGEGGRGYRDTAQDAEGILPLDSAHARSKILRLAYFHSNEGEPSAGWSEIAGRYPENPFKDHPIWLPFTVASYIKETGDVDILKEEIESYEGGSATLYEHMKRALEFLSADKGKRGLTHFGRYNHADWNDAFDALTGDAESVWLTMGLHRSLLTFVELAQLIGDGKTVEAYKKRAEKLRTTVNEVGWDGQWYLRGFTNSGDPIGSKVCEEGKIFLNTQSWAVLGEIADDERADKCLNAVDEYLESAFGPALFAPAYKKYNPELGRITLFVPGTKENAAVFCHAAAFKIVADCMRKRASQAFSTYMKMVPISYPHDIYKAEPYVFSEYMIGPENPYRANEGAFTWLTGTAGWMFLAGTEWILGIRPTYDGLLIDPCIPPEWKSFEMTRVFRKSTYKIKVENLNGTGHGVKEIFVDGEKIEGCLIKPHSDGREHQVNVRLGR